MVNVKALVKQIKGHAKNGRIVWQHVDGVHIVTNTHWAVQLGGESPNYLHGDVLAALLVAFSGNKPQEGESVLLDVGTIRTGPDVSKWFSTPPTSESGKLTRWTAGHDKLTVRIGRTSKGAYVAVNNEYASLVDSAADFNTLGGHADFLYFLDNSVILCPIRVPNIAEWVAELTN